MIGRVIGEIAELKWYPAFDTVSGWRDIEAYEVSPAKLFSASKSAQRCEAVEAGQ